ncbi:HAD family hydrolase [Spirillospora sp. NPDC052242]
MPERDLTEFRAAAHGGAITHIVVEYGRTLTEWGDRVDLNLGMRPVSTTARDAMRAVAEAGVTLALLSNARAWQDRRPALAAAGIDGLFGDRVFLSHEIGVAKPDPAAFEYVLNNLGTAPAEVLAVGNDYAHDIAPAAHIGMRAVLVSRWPIGKRRPSTTWISNITSLPVLLTGAPKREPAGGGAT